ncbi:PDR/VanB family oxidoreductase [Manganibacter manganicus]|uniref:Ferredoxin--NADP(+) reductase n=1 Tax=Manganibacter manganicus TaxID=1873176 RepID=A0A1V8RPE3_9HYPH|nr:PDR/VanB family oxidoreductase [Pseudaminobacter manganicus]OQM75060.1 ferredoxin--NADP(+) reductase [Pseudaminobacter manganicus]
MKSGSNRIEAVVTDVVTVNDLVKRFHFQRVDGGLLPTFSGGAHTVVEMRDGDRTRLNPYSLMSSPLDTHDYTISVRRDDVGRGGSLFMHNQVKPGHRMIISNPVNLFSLDLRARKHLMIAGGIGITPFLAQTSQLAGRGGNFELHYSVRNEALASYADVLKQRHGKRVNIYRDDHEERLDLPTLLAGQPLGTHLYVCGPSGMIDWVRKTAADAGWPVENVHYEHFAAPQPGKPFEVTLAVSGIGIHVGENESLLEAIETAGLNPPYLCRGGVCGQCETNVISHDGKFLHNDHWLSDEDKAAGCKIMPCVSRFEGKSLVLER